MDNEHEQVRNPFLGGGPPVFKFERVGDSVEGTIQNISYREETDPDGNVKRFPDGNPRPVVVVALETPDGEQVRDFVKGRSVTEFRNRVHAVEGPDGVPQVGAYYKRTHSGLGEKKGSKHPEKLFTIEYSSGQEKELV